MMYVMMFSMVVQVWYVKKVQKNHVYLCSNL